MSETFKNIDLKDRFKTEDYLTLIDNYNELINNIRIVYDMGNLDVSAIVEALNLNGEIENYVNGIIINSVSQMIDDALSLALASSVQSAVQGQIEGAIESAKTEINAEFEIFRGEVETDITDLTNYVNQEVSETKGIVLYLQNNINTLVQASINNQLDTYIKNKVQQEFDIKFLDFLKRIEPGEPTDQVELDNGRIWLEIGS